MRVAKKVGLVFFSLIVNVAAGGVIYYFWQPIASWYWNYRPVLGIDFYNTVSYVGHLARHFSFRPGGWWPNWWGGFPMAYDSYPTLHFYLILPLLKFFSLPQAVQFYMLMTGFLFLLFSYLLFWEISKDRVLAAILTIASSFSVALYGPLVWGGSLPYFATQFFLPLVIWLLVRFFNTADKRWYYLSALFLGLSFLGHLQVGFSFTVPLAFLLLLFYTFEKEKFFSVARFKRLFSYFLVAIIVGYTQLGVSLGFTPLDILMRIPSAISPILERLLPGQQKIQMEGVTDVTPPLVIEQIAQFHKSQLIRFITDTNDLFFVFLIGVGLFFFLTFLLRKERKQSFLTLVFALPVAWVLFYGFLFASGVSIFHGGWYRVFWPFPLTLGILTSFIWGDFWLSVKARFVNSGRKLALNIFWIVIASGVVLIPGFFLLKENSANKMLSAIETPRLRQQSSAFPDSLSVYIKNEELEKLKGRLTPSWLNPNETQYRLYDADQRVNIWWSSFFNMPLVKGYIDPPPGDSSGGFYWTSIALTQSSGRDALVDSWKTPEEIAYNNALFLIDWYSIKYLEAEHEPSDSYSPPTSYLAKSDVFAKKEKIVIPGLAQLYVHRKPGELGPIGWLPEQEEYLTYYEIKSDLVSPVAHTTDASRIGVIGAIDAYRTILRDLAATNINSRMVIPLQLGQFIDDVSYETLSEMDAVILYAYDYKNHNKSWDKLEKYVKAGGKVFVETGSEVKQTNSINLPSKYPKELPSIFPLKMTKQEEMGTEWQLNGGSKETEDVNLEDFGAPVIDNKPWRFSLPNSASDLREGLRVVLTNKNIPLIIAYEYGQGEVIWSGMNLPYHSIAQKNMQEVKLFRNLMMELINFTPVEYANYSVERKSAQKIIIKGNKAKGVFFREQNYSGWSAKINSAKINGGLKIFRTGPTYPGFMYVVVPREAQDSNFSVTFSFSGNPWVYFWQIVSLIVILAILDRAILNSRLVVPILLKIYNPLQKRVGKWWEKEEDY